MDDSKAFILQGASELDEGEQIIKGNEFRLTTKGRYKIFVVSGEVLRRLNIALDCRNLLHPAKIALKLNTIDGKQIAVDISNILSIPDEIRDSVIGAKNIKKDKLH